ncbi:DinB family protein [Brevibacterium marinum]|uniref:Putative damage-inducible protein DinB n=1 Tax=Brevibacterium marinum TaxID=418643 RepID=A0A846SBI9_9MICO|nr:DinB family protein [Brevibacterium marinum]NJC58127.1 putative damage-inducible protein DinB [Brevibacterium marinum]
MGRNDAMKTILKNHLQACRNDLVWKLSGLSERDLRMPQTPTGLNLAGIVKHMATVEIGYFGDTFGRPWPHPDEVISDEQFETDPQADWYATEEETAESVLDFYRRVWIFADETIDTHALDAQGTVPHWRAEKAAVSLQQIMVHVIVDLSRHVGQADIVREGIDGQVGLNTRNPNIPEDQDWESYLAKLRSLANNT